MDAPTPSERTRWWPWRRARPHDRTGHRPEAGVSRFVGRRSEIAALQRLVAQAQKGAGQVVGLVAEPGIGKTRLISELRASLSGESLTMVEGRCVSYSQSVPWVPILDIVRAVCRIREDEDPVAVAEKVDRHVAELGIEDDAAAFVLNLLGLPEAQSRLARLSSESLRARTLDALLALLLTVARREPTVVIVEDLHWIDRASEDLLALLMEAAPTTSIVLIASWRPSYDARWLRGPHTSRITVPPLVDVEALEIARAALAGDGPPDEGLVATVIERAEGNPFFIEELARGLRERGGKSTEVPGPFTTSSRRVWMRFPTSTRGVLQTASVLGREFTPALLAEMSADHVDLAAHLDELRGRGFIAEREGTDGGLLVFEHALTQEVAYDGLLTARRRSLHESAGAALERLYAGRTDEAYDRLAYHWSRTDRPEKAVHYLERFADRAARTYANAEAASALRDALTHVDRLPADIGDRRRVELVIRLVGSLYFLGRFGESLDALRRVEPDIDGIGDDRLSGRFHVWMGHTCSHAGDGDPAASVQRALTHAVRVQDHETIGKAYYVLAREGFWLGRLAEGAERGGQAVEALLRTDDWWWLAHSFCQRSGNLCNLGRFAEALANLAAAQEIGRAHDDTRILSYTVGTPAGSRRRAVTPRRRSSIAARAWRPRLTR